MALQKAKTVRGHEACLKVKQITAFEKKLANGPN